MSNFKTGIKNILLGNEFIYRYYLKSRFGGKPKPLGYPKANWHNAVLRTEREWEEALSQIRELGLPAHPEPTKNWDHLAALDCILKTTELDACILDAGAELDSILLPWLYLYGYRNLTAINLRFKNQIKRGPINYIPGDITKTKFRECSFDAIACLSVIEHGVDLESYFRETARILKPGGILITSTDYFEERIDTGGKMAYGVPIKIFSRDEIMEILGIAQEFNFQLTDFSIDLSCKEKPVSWKEYSLEYTFLIFTLWKKD